MNISKQKLRQQLQQQRQALSATARAEASHKITQKILALSQFQQSKTVALYFSIGAEVVTDALFKACFEAQKQCYVPIIDPSQHGVMQFARMTETSELQKNHYEISEPVVKEIIATNELDFVIVPLVGFDRHYNRLGMGAGFYDRAFASCKHPFLCGIAYQCQMVAKLNSESWDVPLNIVITE